MSELSLKTLVHVINAKTSYNVLLKKPKLHKNMVIIPLTLQCLKFCREVVKNVEVDFKLFTKV